MCNPVCQEKRFPCPRGENQNRQAEYPPTPRHPEAMLASLCTSTTGFNVVPAHSLPVAARRANPFMVTETEAKAAWLAKLDAPAWGAAAAAVDLATCPCT